MNAPARADYRTDGQKSAREHASQRGFRATHVLRPCRMTRRLKAPRSAAGMNALSTCSTLTASRPRRGGQTFGQVQPFAHPQHVRVDGEPRKPERHTAHDVARLAADAGNGDQILERARHDAPVPVGHRARHADEAPRLGTEETGGTDELLHVLGIRRGERLGVGIRREEGRRHHVHASVRALGRQDGRRQQLEGVLEIQSAQLDSRAGVDLGQALGGQAGPTFRCPGLRHRFTVPGYVGRSGRSGRAGHGGAASARPVRARSCLAQFAARTGERGERPPAPARAATARRLPPRGGAGRRAHRVGPAGDRAGRGGPSLPRPRWLDGRAPGGRPVCASRGGAAAGAAAAGRPGSQPRPPRSTSG